MNIIAIDCGASFTKFALFEDELLKEISRVPTPKSDSDEDVFDTSAIESLIEIIQSHINTMIKGIRECTICIDNEMHGFILASSDGKPYTGYISWQKELMPSSIIMQLIREAFGNKKAERIIRKTGMPLRSGLPSTSLRWLYEENHLEVDEDLYFYTLGDYIIRRISGQNPICHPTNAAATGLYDLESGDWNKEYISLITGGNDIAFPKIGNGIIEYSINEKCKVKILSAIGDQQAALLGSGFRRDTDLSFNMGTGAQVSRIIYDVGDYGDYQIRPYFCHSYIKTIPHVPSGRAVNVMFRFISDILGKANCECDDEFVWDMMHDALSLESTHDANIQCDLSFFENAITNNTRGSISNIGEYDLGFESLMNSVFKQLIDNFLHVAKKVNAGMEDYSRVIMSGGMALKWEVLRQGIMEGLDTEAELLLSEHDALYGCMRYALLDKGDR